MYFWTNIGVHFFMLIFIWFSIRDIVMSQSLGKIITLNSFIKSKLNKHYYIAKENMEPILKSNLININEYKKNR